jgi:hypothetical protein
VTFRLLGSLLVLVAIAQAGSFDKPVLTKTIDLGPARFSPGSRSKVTCYFFPSFMVKEVDTGAKGADRLAIVPASKNKLHTCSRMRDEGEETINPDDWSGYFKGVKGHLVFFDADDGWNGGMGFAVFDSATATKIFDDVALGDIELVDRPDKVVELHYTRVVDGGCIVPKEQAACWTTISKKFALENAGAPDCKSGYEKSAQVLAKGRCQAQNKDNPECIATEITLARQQSNDSPSVVSYAVDVVLGDPPTIKPAGGDVRCGPAD